MKEIKLIMIENYKVGFLKTCLANLHIFLFLFVFLTGCSNFSADDDNEYLILCYNKEFGQRFSLPAEKSVTLSKGLYAIGFEQSKQEGMRLYLYIDSSLDIYSPKECGDFCINHNKCYTFLYFGEKDHNIFVNRMMKLDNRLMLLSKSLSNSDKGFVDSVEYEFIQRDILPGLTLISVRGFSFPVFESKHSPLEILVQKNDNGAPVFSINGPINYERVYRFEIPEKLAEQIRKHLREDWVTHREDNPRKIYYP